MRKIIIGNGNYGKQNDTVVIPLEGDPVTLMAQLKGVINTMPDQIVIDLATRRKLKKYHVVMQSTDWYGIDVEAYDEGEAAELAAVADGGEFVLEYNTPWKVNEVRKIEE